MWRSLVWKEWHEQRWRLSFGVFLLGMFTLIGLRTRIMPDEQIIIMGTMMIGGMLFPLMVSMGLVAPERADGTIVRLLALPVPAWKVLAAKGVVGAAVCVAPIVVSTGIAAVIAGDREMSREQFWGMHGIAVVLSLAMFAWLTAASVRQPSEARAGLVGAGFIVGWFLLVGVAAAVQEAGTVSRTHEWVATVSPIGAVMLKDASIPRAAVIGLQVLSISAAWCWAAWRIAKPGKVVP